MVSPTALICKRYAAVCTKTRTKILQVKREQKQRNAPEIVRKGRNRVRFGCWREVQQVWTGGEPQNLNQSAPHSHATHEKRKPAKTQCFRRFCGRGRRTWSRLPARVLLPGGERPAPTEAGAETGAAERHWRSLTPRHALRRAQPCLVAKSYRTLTKKSGTAQAIPDFFGRGRRT